MDILYSEYKKTKREVTQKQREGEREKNRVEEKESRDESDNPHSKSQKYTPSLSDLIAGYIYRYQFLDLFSSNFVYTVADLTPVANAALLTRTLSSTLDADDVEMLRIIDLHLESDHMDANPELIERSFRDLLRGLHVLLLNQEKNQKLIGLDPGSDEVYILRSEFAKKEKQL
jgi:hypothetical protein